MSKPETKNIETVSADQNSGAKYTFWELIAKLGCYVQPYPGGGAQVFIGRADVDQPELYREFWNLKDAHVAGTLSGPALHVFGNKTTL